MIEETASNMLSTITRIYDHREELYRKPNRLQEVEEDIKQFSDFLKVPEKPASILAVIICESIMGDHTHTPELMQHMGFAPADFLETNAYFKTLRKRGLLRMKQTRSLGRRQHYEVAPSLMDAVVKNDSGLLKEKRSESLREALNDLHRYIYDLRAECDGFELSELLMEYMDYYREHAILNQILEDQDLYARDKLILVWLMAEQMKGAEEHDVEDYMNLLLSDDIDKQCIREEVRKNTSGLFIKGYLTFPNTNFPTLTRVILEDDMLKHFQQQNKKELSIKRNSKFYKVLVPDEIQQTPLHFNKKNLSQINELRDMVSQDNFTRLSNRLQEKGLKKGLTLLLYGAPGTGKTELVKQLGKQHDRPIMQVEISSIKSAWVGESEKNLQRVFKEYQEVMKASRQTPILLFNEADALMTKRLASHSSVDQMVNTMQNILLQALEDFEGIFIATTNLIHNMDGAFDRRMLYKVRFEMPDQQARYHILKQSLEFVPDALLRKISREHTLSGGQIMNLRKKLLIDELLGNDSQKIKTKLMRYIAEETGFRTRTQAKPIGFVLPNKR